MKDITLANHLHSLKGPGTSVSAKNTGGTGFQEALNGMIDSTNRAQVEADRAVEKLHSGEAKNLHEVMLSLEKADISMRMLVQVRNKVVEAYQEIMRMSV